MVEDKQQEINTVLAVITLSNNYKMFLIKQESNWYSKGYFNTYIYTEDDLIEWYLCIKEHNNDVIFTNFTVSKTEVIRVASDVPRYNIPKVTFDLKIVDIGKSSYANALKQLRQRLCCNTKIEYYLSMLYKGSIYNKNQLEPIAMDFFEKHTPIKGFEYLDLFIKVFCYDILKKKEIIITEEEERVKYSFLESNREIYVTFQEAIEEYLKKQIEGRPKTELLYGLALRYNDNQEVSTFYKYVEATKKSGGYLPRFSCHNIWSVWH